MDGELRKYATKCIGGQHYLVVYIPLEVVTPVRILVSEKETNLLGMRLTHRETQVMQGLIDFKQNKEIASELGISERTVKFFVSSLLEKYECSGRAQLADRFRSKSEPASIQ
jgi:two-component system, NarL family, nitrate/nitrite response regulator NarL